MSIDTNKPLGKVAEWYVNLFSNRWNYYCDICFFLFGAAVHTLAGVGIGFFIGANVS